MKKVTRRSLRENIKSKDGKKIIIFLSVCFAHALLLFKMRLEQRSLNEVAENTLVLKEETEKILIQLKNSKSPIIEKQIVETEKTIIDPKIPLNESEKTFLSIQDQKVLKQTRAAQNGEFKNKSAGKKTIISPKENSTTMKKEQKKIAEKKKTPKTKMSLDLLGQASLKLSKDLDHELEEKEKELLENTKDIAEDSQESKSFRDGAAVAQTNDYLDDIPLGELTQLNTKEYKFYGFYYRIKKKLEQHWGQSLQQKADTLMKQGRRLPADVHRITGLKVHLDAKGAIIKVDVKNTSGSIELDDAAIESFRKAGPFPNPPVEMVNNGVVTIEWGFVVKT